MKAVKASAMQITLLKSKLHRVHVTHCELHYEGSCANDAALLEAANIREYEQIHLYNVSNGERFSTYAILGERHSGIISVNGAAAHKANVNDIIIIASYANYDEAEAAHFEPRLIYVDAANRMQQQRSSIPPQTFLQASA